MELSQSGYRFVKEIPSDTRAKAIHIKIGTTNYQIVTAPSPAAYKTYAYEATRTGKVISYSNALVIIDGSDYELCIQKLLEKLQIEK